MLEKFGERYKYSQKKARNNDIYSTLGSNETSSLTFLTS